MSAAVLARGEGLPEIAYSVEGDGPPVVLIHGVGADASSWDAIAPRLASRFTVARLDLRGHGKSGRIAESIRLEDFARDVTDVMDALNIRSCRLVGFSLGGLIAQSVALDAPERVERLALLSTVAGRSDDERAKVRSRLELLRTQGIDAIIQAAQDRWFTEDYKRANPDKVAMRMRQMRENDPASYLHAYTVFCTSDLADRLGGIAVETLIVTGENDVGSNTRMAHLMHERIRRSELHIMPRLRHSILVEAPDAVASLLLDFL